jgi:tetratricopeptide (TPR) repeat protein
VGNEKVISVKKNVATAGQDKKPKPTRPGWNSRFRRLRRVALITRMTVQGERMANLRTRSCPMPRLRDIAGQSGYCGNRIAIFLLILIALLTAFSASAKPAQGQSKDPADSATLQGSVLDSHGRPVAAATVYLQSGDQTLTARTDSAGAYRFPALPEAVYSIRVEMAGYGKASFGPCVLGPKESKRIDLTLETATDASHQSGSPGTSAAEKPQFYDEPEFTVAGVTEAMNPGGHGSDTILRNTETLAKETVSLAPINSQPPSSSVAEEASLRKLADREPGSFDANRRIGTLLVENGKPGEALPYLERAAQLNPASYENSYELALAHAAAGQYDRARADARTLLTGQEKLGQKGTQEQQAELHQLLGDVEEKLGNPLEAVREYQRAAELDPSEPNLFDWGSDLLLHRAFEPAIEVFTKGNRLFPRSVRMLVGLGVGWYARGAYDLAAQRLCEASDLNPDDPTPYLFMGKMESAETAQSACMVERLARFAKLQPENALADYYYALSLSRRDSAQHADHLAQAESLLEKAVRLDPKLGIAYLQLGILDVGRGDFPKAIVAYQKAIAANPELEQAHYRLAQAYSRTGEPSKAQAELQLYEQLSKKTAEERERERREIQQFVYTLREPTPTQKVR